MSHIHVPDTVPELHLPRTGLVRTLGMILMLVGAVAFFITLGRDADQAWRAYVVNWLFFTAISMGAVVVAVVTWIVKAKWNWSVRRVSLAFVAFLPVSFVLFLPMLTLGGDYFPWVAEMEHDPIIQNKAAYLNMPFLIARNVIGLLVLFGMSLYFASCALRPDLGRASTGGDTGRSRWKERLTQRWTSQEQEEEASYQTMTRMAPALILVYVVVFSMISYDWIMSLEPHWFSTLFGGWFFMGALWAGFALTALTTVFLRLWNKQFAEAAGSQQLWDLGKLTFAFCVFWTYLFWSQYIVIWYGKLPWEQAWIVHRSEAPWHVLSLLVICMCFVIPFAGLIGKQPKMKPAWLATMAGVILAGQWLWQYTMVVPAIHHGGPAITWWEPAIGLFFLGALLLSVRWFFATFPVIQLWQPQADPESLEAELGLTGKEMLSR